MSLSPIDPEICAALVSAAAARIAAITARPAPDAGLSEMIAWIGQVSRDAAEVLRAQLAALYPQIAWLDEEARPDAEAPAYWLYDAVDGAYHYLQGLPLWASSLVLMRGGQPVLSIVYDASLREVFIAAAGQGATCNGKKLGVSAKTDARTAVAGTAIPPLAQVGQAEQDEAIALIGAVAARVFVVRPMAAVSLQLAYVAAGRLDAYWENGNDTADWLAGGLLVREAGGIVTDLAGDFGWDGEGILAGNARLHETLLPVIAAGRRL